MEGIAAGMDNWIDMGIERQGKRGRGVVIASMAREVDEDR